MNALEEGAFDDSDLSSLDISDDDGPPGDEQEQINCQERSKMRQKLREERKARRKAALQNVHIPVAPTNGGLVQPTGDAKAQAKYYRDYAEQCRKYAKEYPEYAEKYKEYALQYEGYAREVKDSKSKRQRTDAGPTAQQQAESAAALSEQLSNSKLWNVLNRIDGSAADVVVPTIGGVKYMPPLAAPEPEAQEEAPDYSVVGSFNKRTGRYEKDGRQEWSDCDRVMRQMGHYFDYDKWSEERNLGKHKGGGRKTKTRL